MEKLRQSRGAISKIVLLVVFLLAAAAVLGVITYRMAVNDNDELDPELQATLDQAECEHVNDDLCKFFAVWDVAGDLSAQATRTQDGTEKTYTYKSDEQGNYQLSASGEKSYEVVAVEQTVYVREAGGNWYQQDVEDVSKYREDNNALNFSEPTSEEAARAYQEQGTEDCGELTCFRYTVDMGDEGTQNIWFDDQEYRLRRITVVRDNYAYDASISYEEVSIKAPEQSILVAQGEQIPPGKTKPEVLGADTSDLPDTGDVVDPDEYRQWLEQRGDR